MTVDTNVPEQKPAQNDAQLNFERLRKQLENERYAREQAEARNKQYEEEKQARSKPKEDEEDSYDEPYIDEKRLNKKFTKWEADFDKKIDQKAEAKARQLFEQEKQASFLRENKDFETIMTPELLKKFVDTYPDVAEGILNNMPDDFNRQKHVYKTIKSLKLHQKPEDNEVQKLVNQNQRNAIYQPSGIAPSPYKAAGDFSRDGQAQAYDQMKELAARFGGGGVKMR